MSNHYYEPEFIEQAAFVSARSQIERSSESKLTLISIKPCADAEPVIHLTERGLDVWETSGEDARHTTFATLARELSTFLWSPFGRRRQTPQMLEDFDAHIAVYIRTLRRAGYCTTVLTEEESHDGWTPLDDPLPHRPTYVVYASNGNMMYTFGSKVGHGHAYAVLCHYLKTTGRL